MTVIEAVTAKLRTLSEAGQRKVLEFVESLERAEQPPTQRNDPRGMFAHRGVHITAEEIDEARREAWVGFPRDFPDKDGP